LAALGAFHRSANVLVIYVQFGLTVWTGKMNLTHDIFFLLSALFLLQSSMDQPAARLSILC
jgi:hypothetical protein